MDDEDSLEKVLKNRKSLLDTHTGSGMTYDFIFRPPAGILNSIKPLAPKFEMIISFDRAVSDLSLISTKANSKEPLAGKEWFYM